MALREKIEYLIKNTHIAIEMGNASRLHVENNFNWDLVVNRCLQATGARGEFLWRI